MNLVQATNAHAERADFRTTVTKVRRNQTLSGCTVRMSLVQLEPWGPLNRRNQHTPKSRSHRAVLKTTFKFKRSGVYHIQECAVDSGRCGVFDTPIQRSR